MSKKRKVDSEAPKKAESQETRSRPVEIVKAIQEGKGGEMEFVVKGKDGEKTRMSREEVLDGGHHLLLIEFYERHLVLNKRNK